VVIPTPPTSSIQFGVVTFHIYGLCIALGAILAILLANYRYQKFCDLEKTPIYDIAIIALPSAIIGARIYYVITQPQTYLADWTNIFKIWEGGLGIYGGVIGGIISSFIYCRFRKISFKNVTLAVIPTIALAQSIGRIGNWFNGELYGKPTNSNWGLNISRGDYHSNVLYHPTFLYEIVWNMLIFTILMFVTAKSKNAREWIIPLYLISYSFGRFWIELLRIDSSTTVLGLRTNLYFIVAVFVCALLWFCVVLRSLSRNRQVAETLGKR
jgi:prolipoprotein diacylglyceryl transferase